MEIISNDRSFVASDAPPRSHLYPLTPCGLGTPLVESLTSYVTRLAWTYRIRPHVLVEQEIIPNLRESEHFRVSPEKSSTFCQREAMAINGTGEIAINWIDTLARLTTCGDLRNLTLPPWANRFPIYSLLHSTPRWCSACYHEWRRDEQPIYQPLLWLFQVIMICPIHRRRLEEKCFHCKRRQSVIAVQTSPGFCTQCKTWLGKEPDPRVPLEVDHKTIEQQEWVLRVIEELRQAGTSIDPFPQKKLLFNLATYVRIMGGSRRNEPFAHLLNTYYDWLALWITSNKPSLPFHKLLDLCYALNVSPLQLITTDPIDLRGPVWLNDLRQLYKPSLILDPELARPLVHGFLEGRESSQLREIRDAWVLERGK